MRSIEKRTLHASADAATARRVVRARLRRMLADVPGAWLGRTLEPGVSGFAVGNCLLLQAIPPDRTLLTNRKSPTVMCRIASCPDGGCDIRLSIYPYGFPWSAVTDARAVAFFDDWLSGVGSELGAR